MISIKVCHSQSEIGLPKISNSEKFLPKLSLTFALLKVPQAENGKNIAKKFVEMFSKLLFWYKKCQEVKKFRFCDRHNPIFRQIYFLLQLLASFDGTKKFIFKRRKVLINLFKSPRHKLCTLKLRILIGLNLSHDLQHPIKMLCYALLKFVVDIGCRCTQ